MIKANFIPENLRKERSDLLQDGFVQVPKEIAAGILLAGIGFLILVHALFGLVALIKVGQYQVMLARWNAMSSEKKELDTITQETQVLQKKMFSLKPITSARGIVLGKMMNEISDSIPRGVWLREIRYDGALLSIKGSAVSKVNNEVIIAGDFVTALKEKPAITEHFMGLQLESIERRENSVAAIVDFLLKAKMKVQ